MSTWTVRVATVAACACAYLTAATLSPLHGPTFTPGPITSGTPTQAQLKATNINAAVGHIAADAASHTCAPVDALEADTALVRYVGTVDVVRLTASKAWAEAEQSDVVVYAWCAPTGGGAA